MPLKHETPHYGYVPCFTWGSEPDWEDKLGAQFVRIITKSVRSSKLTLLLNST